MKSALPGRAEITRRTFLKLAGGTTLMASIPSTASDGALKALPERTVEKDKFKFDAVKGVIEWGAKKEPYKLIVDGLVKKSQSFSYAEIASFPRIEQACDFHCVEGWSVRDLPWGGFRFKEILSRIEPAGKATHVLFHSFGTTISAPKGQSHYIESLPMSELIDPEREILLALTMHNRPLPEEHGSPLRLIAPYDLAYKSIKFISRIEFINGERAGWWTLANPIYPIVARVPKSRLQNR
jgi:DMSO/TMAO reductase YedYZ molybdopterin-dependent catalytic subunit